VTQNELERFTTQRQLDNMAERITALEERTPQTIFVYMLNVMLNPLERAKLLQVYK
jgi:DNA-binding ferritin-like protein